jgi:hypothetical protein
VPSVPRLIALTVAVFVMPAQPVIAADETVEVHLDGQAGSNEPGVVVLTAKGEKTLVVVHMKNPPGEPQPAHFHTGTCANYTPRPLYPLKSVVHGESTTLLDVPIAKLTGGDLVVNVHKSFEEVAVVASCGVSKAP